MCSKLFTYSGKSGGFCSSPLSKTGRLPSGIGIAVARAPLACMTQAHTILLIEVPSCRVRALRTPQSRVSKELSSLHSLHGQYISQVIANGKMCQYEWTMQHKDKTHIQQTTLLPLAGPQGQTESIVSVTRDISGWADVSAVPHTLQEGTPAKTFAQLLLAARETEKREVSKALHDEIGSTSVILSALVGLVRQDVQDKQPRQALLDLDKLHAQLQACIDRLRGIVVSLRPPNLDTNGALRGCLEELTGQVCGFGRVECRFECAKNFREKGISDHVKIVLYRVVQESLTNVVKHAHAHHVVVRLVRRKDQLILTVQDDGVGFVKEKHRSVKHIGLLSMHDSVRLLGGHLTITTAPGQGTRLRAVCPCVVYEDDYVN